jgi:hypothetical protein
MTFLKVLLYILCVLCYHIGLFFTQPYHYFPTKSQCLCSAPMFNSVCQSKTSLNSNSATKLNICYIYDFNDYSTFVRSWVITRMLAPLRPIMYLWIQFGASTVAVWTLCAFSYTMCSATNSQTHSNKSLHLPWPIPVVWFYWQSKLLPNRSNNDRAHLCSGIWHRLTYISC